MREGKEGRVLFSRKVSPGEGFEFQYIHSVDKTPVTGYFLITRSQKIKPLETRFESYGAGLPSTEGGVTIEGRKMIVKADVGEMDQFSFFVSPMTNQAVVFKGERLGFSSCREGMAMTIRAKSYPLLWEVIFRYGN